MPRVSYQKIILFLVICQSFAFSQGISRSTGLGIRFGAWNKNPAKMSFISTGAEGDRISISTFLFIYTRFRDNWFWEFNIGGVGDIKDDENSQLISEVTSLVPMIIGLRNDFLADTHPGRIQPYYSFGAGPYLVGYERTTVEQTSKETGLKLGIYGGTGVNVAFTSWFAFNMDLKYHLINISPSNPASGFNLNFGLSLMWGSKREMFRIRDVKLVVTDIYPAYYQFYNLYPLALVSVQNTSAFPIEVNLRSKVSPFSSKPKESGFITIEKGELKDIPATVIFDADITRVSERGPALLDIEVEGRAGMSHREEVTAQITVHTRNSWNGEGDKLAFFVTPDEEEIIRLSRQFTQSDSDSVDVFLTPLSHARMIFNQLGQLGIHYQSDPNVPFYQDDRVQYAAETLGLKSGDCDDLVILYASFLESLGIETAFVQVRDPEKTLAHLYLILNTTVPVEKASIISTNKKRYLVRDEGRNSKTIWIPVETTLISRGFEEAWNTAALNYLKEAELRNGLSEGWVQIFDVN